MLPLVRLTWYFIESREVSKQVVDFLIQNALTHPNPESDYIPSNDTINYEQDPLSYGINTVRGAAAEALTCLYFKKEYEEEIFDALFKIADDTSLKVRTCILYRLEYMRFLNKEKMLELFLKLTQSNEEYLLKHALNPAYYLSYYNFQKMIPFFEKALIFKSLSPTIAKYLVFAWYEEQDGALSMLKNIFEKNEEARSKMPYIAIKNLYSKDKQINKKSLELFQWFFDDKSEVVHNGYSMAFQELKITDFEMMYPLLKEYAKSKAGKRNLSEYFEYLERCASEYPKECIQLMCSFKGYSLKPTNKRTRSFYKDEPIKVVMVAYNKLDSSIKEHRKYIKIAMKIFDKMLLSHILRQHTNKVLDEID